MLARLYVDNYRCLVNFEWKPKRAQLVIGLSAAKTLGGSLLLMSMSV